MHCEGCQAGPQSGAPRFLHEERDLYHAVPAPEGKAVVSLEWEQEANSVAAGAVPRTRAHAQTPGHTPARGEVRAQALEPDPARPDSCSVGRSTAMWFQNVYFTPLGSSSVKGEPGSSMLWFLEQQVGVCGGTVGVESRDVLLSSALLPLPDPSMW